MQTDVEFKGLVDAAEKRTSHYQTLYTFNLQSFTYARRYKLQEAIYISCVFGRATLECQFFSILTSI